jgi:Mrp family chromosome partitioning ATPase
MKSSQKVDFELADYTTVIRSRWRIVAGATALGLIAGLAHYEIAPKTYTASAVVSVQVTGASPGDPVAFSRTGGSGGVNLDTEANLVTSGTVATMAQHMLRTSVSPAKLASLIKITVPANTSLLNIACSDSTAAGAADCAQAFALAYLQNRHSTAVATLNSQISSLQGKITSLQKSVATLNTELSALAPGSPARIGKQAAYAATKAQLDGLTAQLASLNTKAVNTAGGHIVTAATPPGKPTSPQKLLIVPSWLILGLLLGLIGAFIWDRRDTRLHSAQDVERLGLPVLLTLPRMGRQISLPAPRSQTGRAFTELAHTLTASLGEGSHVVLVTGATPGPAASYVAANLAATLARTHSEAVLVCADLRDSIAPDLFGLTSDGQGLAEVVAGRATVGEVARGPASVPGLWVIPPGADPSLAEYHLQHDTAKALTSQLRRDARYVIIEAQSTADGADTFALADFADTALLTIETNQTRRAQVKDATRRLNQMRVPVLGATLLSPLTRQITIRPPQQTRPTTTGPALTRPTHNQPHADPISGR